MYVGTRHKAVPQFMGHRAYKVATRTDFSNRKFRGSTMPAWKCPRCGQEDSTTHKYSTCVEVKKAWGHTFAAWQRLTGERLDPTDEWLTAWGMRAKTWGSEEEQRQYGGAAKEEVFQVMHKAMIQAIHDTHGGTKSKKARLAASAGRRRCAARCPARSRPFQVLEVNQPSWLGVTGPASSGGAPLLRRGAGAPQGRPQAGRSPLRVAGRTSPAVLVA